jgi:hypothetical protein
MAQIINMILDKIVAGLQSSMGDNVTDINTKANLVKKGLLQTPDKLTKYISIGVTGGDHEDPNYIDGINTMEGLPDIAMDMFPREVGGGQFWQRRFIARVEIYYILQPHVETDATAYAYEVLGRLESNIENVDLSNLTDDYGETAQGHAYCYANTFFQSGGPPQSYIFRGKVMFTVLTERLL